MLSLVGDSYHGVLSRTLDGQLVLREMKRFLG